MSSGIQLSQDPLLRVIEQYYLPRKLVAAIYERGGIEESSVEARVGIGFIDIADYTFLSKFLSPKENQILLNGLYTAFQRVLERHGGFLNKIEGDSMMFQFDGIMDKRLRELPADEADKHIVRQLFFTCVEMQRICSHFNNANEAFLLRDCSQAEIQPLQQAFDIIKILRARSETSTSLDAFFQIRIRIGASLGTVMIGNFGPEGAKHWDIIGIPVIDAKRMESSSPVGGLRISEAYYRILEQMNVTTEYYDRFRREAQALGSRYRTIQKDEVFAAKKVVIHEKRGAVYATYSVQVDPCLPENLGRQFLNLLKHGPSATDRAVEIIQYFRGNPYVIDHLEDLMLQEGVVIRKADLLGLLIPQRLAKLTQPVAEYAAQFRLSKILHLLNRAQDLLKYTRDEAVLPDFLTYDQAFGQQAQQLQNRLQLQRGLLLKRTQFFEVVCPLIYFSLKASLLEYQARLPDADLEELS